MTSGAATRGAPEHLANAAAVWHKAVGRWTYPVRICCQIIRTLPQQNAGILQLLKRKLRVEAHQQRVRVLAAFRNGEARRAELRLHRFRAADVETARFHAVCVQMRGHRVHTGEKVARLRGNAEAR